MVKTDTIFSGNTVLQVPTTVPPLGAHLCLPIHEGRGWYTYQLRPEVPARLMLRVTKFAAPNQSPRLRCLLTTTREILAGGVEPLQPHHSAEELAAKCASAGTFLENGEVLHIFFYSDATHSNEWANPGHGWKLEVEFAWTQSIDATAPKQAVKWSHEYLSILSGSHLKKLCAEREIVQTRSKTELVEALLLWQKYQ